MICLYAVKRLGAEIYQSGQPAHLADDPLRRRLLGKHASLLLVEPPVSIWRPPWGTSLRLLSLGLLPASYPVSQAKSVSLTTLANLSSLIKRNQHFCPIGPGFLPTSYPGGDSADSTLPVELNLPKTTSPSIMNWCELRKYKRNEGVTIAVVFAI